MTQLQKQYARDVNRPLISSWYSLADIKIRWGSMSTNRFPGGSLIQIHGQLQGVQDTSYRSFGGYLAHKMVLPLVAFRTAAVRRAGSLRTRDGINPRSPLVYCVVLLFVFIFKNSCLVMPGTGSILVVHLCIVLFCFLYLFLRTVVW